MADVVDVVALPRVVLQQRDGRLDEGDVVVVGRAAEEGDHPLHRVAQPEPEPGREQRHRGGQVGRADDQVAEAAGRPRALPHGGGAAVGPHHRSGGVGHHEGRCGLGRRGAAGPHLEADPARRVDDRQGPVGPRGTGPQALEPGGDGPQVGLVLAADADRGEPAERAFGHRDGGAPVGPGEPGPGVTGQPELGVEGAQGRRVGHHGVEAEETVQAHGWNGPVPATHALRNSPMPSAPDTTTSPGTRKRPRAMPTPSGVPVKMMSPGSRGQMEER